MAGHSHSANIARRKGAVDAKRGKVFSKLARVIITAARSGGGDPDQNLKLKYAIEKARASNMPKDTIERAIARGTGTKDGDAFAEVVYEGYAPGGVALLVSCLTDNRHRTAPDVKMLFDRAGGALGAPGSVAFQFHLRSVFALERGARGEEAWTELALAIGADDLEFDGDLVTIYGAATEFPAQKKALEAAGVECKAAELAYVPQNKVPLRSKEEAGKVLRLIEALEDHDDVQNVYANYDMPAEWLEELAG
jgi:YebC/PmpR family DNA-binding regulatory protein